MRGVIGLMLIAIAVVPAQARDEVTILRDRWGVPHIDAQTEEGGFFGLGYAQAEDQLQGLLAAFLVTEGRSASVFGTGDLPWGGSALAADSDALQWRHAEEAKAGLLRMPERSRRQQEAFAAGFRRYMADVPQRVPSWAPAVEPWHPLALVRMELWAFNIHDGMQSCLQDDVADESSYASAPPASNAWVIAARRTVEGRTLLLSDPHGDIDGSPFYEFTMKAGALDIGGYAMGSALVLTHSADVAWGLTTGGPRVSDCYRLSVSAAGDYQVHEQRRHVQRRRVSIEVFGGERVQKDFAYALINGAPAPIVARREDAAFAVSTPYFHTAELIHVQFDEMVRAKTTDAVLRANAVAGVFPQNLIVGDSSGSIAYLRAGRTPRRNLTVDWSRPVLATDSRTRWAGLRPYTELVLLRDPPEGFLQNNNFPTGEMLHVRASDYPADVINDSPDIQYRARGLRASEALSGQPKWSLDEAKALALDQKWWGTERWIALRATAARQQPQLVSRFTTVESKVWDRLASFDGEADADSAAALDEVFWRRAFWGSLDGDERKSVADAILQGASLPPTIAVKALEAVQAAARQLLEQTGSVDTVYGTRFRIGRGAESWPLGAGVSLPDMDWSECSRNEAPLGLCVATLRAFRFGSPAPDGTRRANYGSRALRLVQLGVPIRSFSVHNYGQSEAPGSVHFDDQARELQGAKQLKELDFVLADHPDAVVSRKVLRY